MRRLDQQGDRFLVHRRHHDQGAALHLVDEVHVVLHNRVYDRLVEAVRGRDHHVEAGVLDRKAARLRQGIKKVKGSILLVLCVACERGRGGVGQQRLLRGLRPDVRGFHDRRAKGAIRVECLGPPVNLLGTCMRSLRGGPWDCGVRFGSLSSGRRVRWVSSVVVEKLPEVHFEGRLRIPLHDESIIIGVLGLSSRACGAVSSFHPQCAGGISFSSLIGASLELLLHRTLDNLLLLRLVEHLVDCQHMMLDKCELVCSGCADHLSAGLLIDWVEGEEVAGDLILDEQIHEVLS